MPDVPEAFVGAEPEAVFATASYEYGVDVEVNGQMWFPGGRVGMFDCGFTLPYRTWLEAAGTEASVCVTRMWLPDPAASYLIERDGHAPHKVVLPEGVFEIDIAWPRPKVGLEVNGWASHGTRSAFDHEDMALLQAVAGQAAIAIENARLYQSQAERVAELSGLQQIASAMTSSTPAQNYTGTLSVTVNYN